MPFDTLVRMGLITFFITTHVHAVEISFPDESALRALFREKPLLIPFIQHSNLVALLADTTRNPTAVYNIVIIAMESAMQRLLGPKICGNSEDELHYATEVRKYNEAVFWHQVIPTVKEILTLCNSPEAINELETNGTFQAFLNANSLPCKPNPPQKHRPSIHAESSSQQ